MALNPRLRTAAVAAAGLVAGLAGTALLSCVQASAPIHQWRQPPGRLYGSFEPYTLMLTESALDWSQVPFGNPRLYAWRVVRSGAGAPDPDSPGFSRTVSLPVPRAEAARYAEGVAVQWTRIGLHITEPNGVSTFIPARSFTGGR